MVWVSIFPWTDHTIDVQAQSEESQDMAVCRDGFGGVEWTSTQMEAWPLAVLERVENVSGSSYNMFLHRTWKSTRHVNSTRPFT